MSTQTRWDVERESVRHDGQADHEPQPVDLDTRPAERLRPAEAAAPEDAICGFVADDVNCLVVNWWYEARRGAEIIC